MSKNVTYIKRHKKGFIYFHWINAVTYFLFFLTAMQLYTNKFLFLYEAFGAETLQTMHHMLGVIFILNPIVALLITARSGIMTLIREVLHFDKDDVKFLVKFPAELIGKEPEGMPKQGFYNGGERMNILLQALLWLGFVVSGLTLWLGAGHISPAIRTWMIPLHSICAGLGFAAAIGHIYLAIGVNPDSFQGMRDGTVKESYAKHHHAKWVEGLEKEGKLETVERTVK